MTKEGKILVNSASKGVINVLNPINFKTIGSKFIVPNDAYFYHFYFEEPNIIFLGFKDKDGTNIPFAQTGTKLANIGVLTIKADEPSLQN